MKHFAFLISITLISCTDKNSIEKLESDIQLLLDKEEGIFAVAFRDSESGNSLYINEKEKFHAASTIKTPVMIEVFKQVNEAVFSLDDSILVKNEFFSIIDSSLYSLHAEDDSDKEMYNDLGKKKTVAELVYDMIIVSSNLATNLVIDLVDAKKVTSTMRTLGAKDIEVLRGVEDIKAFELGMSNTTTALDLAIIYEKLASGKVVNEKASLKMIEILLDQQFNSIIPALLPDNVKVAHKTGSITGVKHDSGIVILPDGRKYVLVLLSKNLENVESATLTMAEISKMIYNYVVSNHNNES